MHPLSYIPFVLLSVLWVWNVRKNGRTKGLPLPSGPKRWPIVGNLFNLPSGKTWLVYDELFKKHGLLVAHLSELNSSFLGDIISFELLGQRIVVLGSTKRTNDLFGKRSTVYSGRQVPPFIQDV